MKITYTTTAPKVTAAKRQPNKRHTRALAITTCSTVGTTFDADQQIYDPTYGGYNAGRLPTFQQLDLRIDRVFLFDRWILALYLDVQNVLNHQNEEGVIVDYRYVTQIVVPDIPILPTLGIRGSF